MVDPITVIDASPLIYFARINRLSMLSDVVGPVAITPTVYLETVDAGRRGGYRDAETIAVAVDAETIVRVQLNPDEGEMAERLLADPRIGPGECETIAWAARRHRRAIIEDKKARQVAAGHGVRTQKSVDILYVALLRGQIDLAGFRAVLRDLARITGIDPATLFEHEALADEIAARLR